MKLLQKIGRYFISFSLLILIICGLGVYLGLQYMLDHEMDENLYHTRTILLKELSKMDSLPPVLEIMDEVIDIKAVSSLSEIEIYQDTFRLVEEMEDGELTLDEEPFRQYIYTEKIKGRPYRISLNHSKFDTEDLFAAISLLVFSALFLFLIALNLFNRFLSQTLWKPFHQTINQIEKFSFDNPEPIQVLKTDISEFNSLNSAISKMINKLTQDYSSLKRFAENASHEFQTPLAIIKSQLDLLLQKETQKENLQYIRQIQTSANKLAKLNKSLLLLTKIENRQFESVEKLRFDEILDQKLETMAILFEGKKLKLHKEIEPYSLLANPLLLDIFFSNILSNAIRHNLEGGEIQITLSKHGFYVRNTGIPLKEKSPEELLERFHKADDSGKTLGLGLAIVAEICKRYEWDINYQNKDIWHELKIDF